MEERLNKLKKSLNNSEFKDLQFTDNHKKNILNQLHRPHIEEELLLSIFQLLVEEKTGFTLSKKLRARGIRRFEDNEGHLYTILHRLEHKGYTQAEWKNGNEKYYHLTKKGGKLLDKYESSPRKQSLLQSLTEVLQP
ncbi:PadR family transcriptional regulator [Halobacillus locisalis]|uniref:PadR family transcriptional regulator n=1 Tax=Halobacillus locisalis TaxID=220753 RepID=A0A838CVV7_9BACI|nr:PadR family transcriptional regulator [Halobacillus locisalis]MBA2176051.1 PadR family transcriptional regulator [Halobacillus locisalis]